MTYYVTGGAGFIGSNLIKMLNKHNINDIVVVDDFGSDEKWKNLLGLNYLSIVSPASFIENAGQISSSDTVFHLGACSSTTETNVDFLIQNNYLYSRKLADACFRNPRFIYASSAAVYGLDDECKDSEIVADLTNLKPRNPYGWSKLLMDQYVCKHESSLNAVGLRFFNVWGRNEDHKGKMASLASRMLKSPNKPIQIFRDKVHKLARDFIYVDDVCNIMIDIANNKEIKGIFNVGTGVATPWTTMAESFIKQHALMNGIDLNVEHDVGRYTPSKSYSMEMYTEESCDSKSFYSSKRKSNYEFEYEIVYSEIPQELKMHYQYVTKADITKLRNAINPSFTPLDVAMRKFVRGE